LIPEKYEPRRHFSKLMKKSYFTTKHYQEESAESIFIQKILTNINKLIKRGK